MNTLKKHGFFWVMFGLLLISLAIHWITAWNAYNDDVKQHGAPPNTVGYLNEVARQMFENIQSEIIQLILQITLVSVFWFVGSPQSKSEEERLEAKIDWLCGNINSLDYDRFKKDVERRYPQK